MLFFSFDSFDKSSQSDILNLIWSAKGERRVLGFTVQIAFSRNNVLAWRREWRQIMKKGIEHVWTERQRERKLKSEEGKRGRILRKPGPLFRSAPLHVHPIFSDDDRDDSPSRLQLPIYLYITRVYVIPDAIMRACEKWDMWERREFWYVNELRACKSLYGHFYHRKIHRYQSLCHIRTNVFYLTLFEQKIFKSNTNLHFLNREDSI